jgi:hypothetical protein
MKSPLRFILSLLLGCAVPVAIAFACFTAARAFWPAYVAAEPHKHYTLAMLIARLCVGAISVAVAACATTAAARDNGRAAWSLGALFLIVSIPSHVYPGYSWHDYPVWYHLLYLSYLVPIAGLSARLFRHLIPRDPAPPRMQPS